VKRDLIQQAYGAMRHDLRKTVLTMLGMAWGIATVVLLLAYGEGFGAAIQAIWDSYGARPPSVSIRAARHKKPPETKLAYRCTSRRKTST
jgi:hypothetical protein